MTRKRSVLSRAPFPLVSANVCRRSPRIRKWRKGNACSPFSPLACSNRGSSRRTVKRSLRNARCSCSVNLRPRTEPPRIARRVKLRRTRKRRINGGLYYFHLFLLPLLTAVGASRQQKQAKEEGRAQRAAEKAAEEAAFKEKQAQLEATQKKKREDEKARREAARKQAEEERTRKEEERRRRAAEEKEREVERERKRRDKEERLKAERKEKEERERKAKEEREAKLATERAARKEREERDERDRKAREEKDAKERAAAKEREQRAVATAAAAVAATNKGPLRAPTSPRNATPSGSSSQRSPNNALSSKKVTNKTQPTQPSVAPSPVASRAPSQSQTQPAPGSQTVAPSQQSQPQRQPMTVSTTSQPLLPVTPQLPPVPPLPSPLFSPNGPSPRGFAPPSTPFGVPAPSFAPPLAPSALPPGFPGAPAPGPARGPFDMTFPRAQVPPAPIGPPSSGLAPGAGRRSSSNNIGSTPAPDVGLIGRPLAPIGRPSTSGTTTPPSATSTSTGSLSTASPVRRSPSPKGVLGSSALAADDDEIVSDRRVVGGSAGVGVGAPPGWRGFGSPRAGNIVSPWGPSAQQQQQQQPLGFGLGLGARPGPPPPPGPPPLGAQMWGGAGLGVGVIGAGAPDPQWHPAAANHFFTAQSPFVHGSPTSPHNGA